MVELESAEIFRSLKPEPLKQLRQIAIERRFSAGERIFSEGEPGDGLYVVSAGQVEISGIVNQQAQRVFTRIGPGEMFGEMAVIEQRPRSATAIAVEETVAWFFPRDEMLRLIEQVPGLALTLLQVISNRLRDFNQHYLREVVQAERLAVVGRFARSIVHDLKNPLNIIGLTMEMACRPAATQEYREGAQVRVRRQVDRISEMISEIMYFTQGADTTLIFSPMNYCDFIGQIVDELREEASARRVTFALRNEPPATALALNPKRLRRVFFNLLHNAADAVPNGGEIHLSFSASNGEVITEFADNGPGIAPEIAGKLFQAFATHGKEHGTGLGLSICKKIIEDHGGRIWAQNAKNGGAVFSFALPIAKAPAAG